MLRISLSGARRSWLKPPLERSDHILCDRGSWWIDQQRFPTDPQRRKDWHDIVPVKHSFYHFAKICSLHFKNSDYIKSTKLKTEAMQFFDETPSHDGKNDSAENKPQILEILLRERWKKEHMKLSEIYESAKESTKEPAISIVSMDHDYCLRTASLLEVLEAQNDGQDSLTVDQQLQIPLDSNHNNDLIITIEDTPIILENDLSVKSEPIEIINKPDDPNKEFMILPPIIVKTKSYVFDKNNVQDSLKVDQQLQIPVDNNHSNDLIITIEDSPTGSSEESKNAKKHTKSSEYNSSPILEGYLRKRNAEDQYKSHLIQESKKLKGTIADLKQTVRTLKKQIDTNKKKDHKMKIVLRKVRNYLSNSEMDNILNMRFKELCKLVINKSTSSFDYTADVIKFAASLHCISPRAYMFVKKYIDLPSTETIRKYEARGSCVVYLD